MITSDQKHNIGLHFTKHNQLYVSAKMLPWAGYRENEKKMFTAACEVWDLVPLNEALSCVFSFVFSNNALFSPFYFLHYRVCFRLYFITIHYSRLLIFNIILFIFLCTWKSIAIHNNTLVKVRDFNPTTQLWKYPFHFRDQPDHGNILAETSSWLYLINKGCLGSGCTINTLRTR